MLSSLNNSNLQVQTYPLFENNRTYREVKLALFKNNGYSQQPKPVYVPCQQTMGII